MSLVEIRIPDIGDANDVEVIEICVSGGDEIQLNDALIVIESDKASMEVPSTVAGTVNSIAVEIGDLVNANDLVVTVECIDEPVSGTTEAKAVEPETETLVDTQSATTSAASQIALETPEPVSTAKLESNVGRHQVEVRVPDIEGTDGVVVIEILVASESVVEVGDPLIVLESDKASMEIPTPVSGVVDSIHVKLEDNVVSDTLIAKITTEAQESRTITEAPPQVAVIDGPVESALAMPPERPTDASLVYAGPAVRRLARELGVELSSVSGSGSKSRIVKDDVKAFVKGKMSQPRTALEISQVESPPYFEEFGEIEKVAISRIRRAGAQNLSRSWAQVVHVTQHDEADATELEAFRRQLNNEARLPEDRLTALPFILKCCVHVLQQLPQFNASIDTASNTLIVKRYYHLGVAVDTDEGLVVPVIRDADKKGIKEIASEMMELSELARKRRLKPDQVTGASFTVSNLGRLGGTGFTPIVNWPEVAILGVGRLATKPVWKDDAFEPRSMLPLSLSYDHRAINGVEAGQFVQDLARLISDVRRILL